jgi:hypothetical protein
VNTLVIGAAEAGAGATAQIATAAIVNTSAPLHRFMAGDVTPIKGRVRRFGRPAWNLAVNKTTTAVIIGTPPDFTTPTGTTTTTVTQPGTTITIQASYAGANSNACLEEDFGG